MLETITGELGVSTTVAWALIVLVIVQVTLQIVALVDLARRRRVRWDMKWVWALIIIFGGNMLLGPILYLAIGRNVPEQVDVQPAVANGKDDRTRRAVDALYGEDEGAR
ncbi:MAG: PLD nuclease N-terminal domain-containing protein [Coriobacteriia bacterium]|nr:PLD nuclease N-terminal domain-containing protein [Coriobacteriia bacterium]